MQAASLRSTVSNVRGLSHLVQFPAVAFGDRVIGVVLSVADRDGASGLAAMKARDGLSVMQNPADPNDSACVIFFAPGRGNPSSVRVNPSEPGSFKR